MRRIVRHTALLVAAVCAAAPALAGCARTVAGVAGIPPGKVDVSEYVPSRRNPDPSKQIAGVQVQDFAGGKHVSGKQRVAYTVSPPIGGNHDQAWAACNGVVYPTPVRSENLVHSLEHGAVWIAYDPERIRGADLAALAARVDGKPYMVMSPYPGLGEPVSLQSWGHQLALSDPDDPRIDKFIAALRQNPNTFPEPGATCADPGPPYFSQDDPPPFVAPPAVSEANGTTVVAQ